MDSWMTEQRILFMSESNMLLHLFEENLDNEMYEIEVLDCDIKGVESVEKLHPDLILLDVEDEEQQKRWDFLNVVKHHDATADIPVLLCTDESQELREQERDFQMLNIQLLYKPFNKDDLLDALRQIVQPFSSAAEVANAHKRNISMLQGAINLLSGLGQKFFPHWTPSFVAWAKQRFNGEVLQDAHLQEQTDLLEVEERQDQEQDDLLVQTDKSGELLEMSLDEQKEQIEVLEKIDTIEEINEKGVEGQIEQEKESLPEPEEQKQEMLSVAR
jgi:DNA-binding response OmpR family regulator